MKLFFLGLVLGLIALPAAAWIYLESGRAPVATADAPLPFERAIVHRPLNLRIQRDMPKGVPLEANAANLENGAHIYREQCASCHGGYGRTSAFAKDMFPQAPQLWAPHRNGVVGVSDDPPGETYWKVSNGIRLSGMPAFRDALNDTQRWQVTLLLANANKPLPPDILTLLKQPIDLDKSGSQSNP